MSHPVPKSQQEGHRPWTIQQHSVSEHAVPKACEQERKSGKLKQRDKEGETSETRLTWLAFQMDGKSPNKGKITKWVEEEQIRTMITCVRIVEETWVCDYQLLINDISKLNERVITQKNPLSLINSLYCTLAVTRNVLFFFTKRRE